MESLPTIWAAGDVSREASPPISVAALHVIQVTDFRRACQKRWQKKLLPHKTQQNLLDFSSNQWLCPHNNCVATPATHFGQSSVIVCQCFELHTGENSKPVPEHWKLVSAQSLVITIEDFVRSRSHHVLGAWEVLAASPYPDDDYWMWRMAAKKRKENWRTLCKVRFVTFSTFLSLQHILSLSGFSCMLLYTEQGRIF